MNINQEVARIMDELAIADAETEAEIAAEKSGKPLGNMATQEYRERRRKWEEIRHRKQQEAANA